MARALLTSPEAVGVEPPPLDGDIDNGSTTSPGFGMLELSSMTMGMVLRKVNMASHKFHVYLLIKMLFKALPFTVITPSAKL